MGPKLVQKECRMCSAAKIRMQQSMAGCNTQRGRVWAGPGPVVALITYIAHKCPPLFEIQKGGILFML